MPIYQQWVGKWDVCSKYVLILLELTYNQLSTNLIIIELIFTAARLKFYSLIPSM